MVAARRIQPGIGVAYLEFLHRAFYQKNQDITDVEVLLSLAEEFGFERQTYQELYDAPETQAALKRDFAAAQKLGIRGFPALVGRSDTAGFAVLTLGYQPLAAIEGQIAQWQASLGAQSRQD